MGNYNTQEHQETNMSELSDKIDATFTEVKTQIIANRKKAQDAKLPHPLVRPAAMLRVPFQQFKGPKGDKGDTVVGPAGKDADEQKIISEVVKQIPKPKDGKDGLDAVATHGEDGKDGSPDTAEEVAGKLNTLKEKVEVNVIKGLEDTIDDLKESIRILKVNVQSAKGKGGGGGGGSTSFITVTADYVIQPNDGVVRVDTTNGDVTVTLPPANQMARRELHIKKIDESNNKITIKPKTGETIDTKDCITFGSGLRDSRRIYSTGKEFDRI